MIADPRVVQWMIRAAEKNKIPYQREVLLIGGTDARAIQPTRAGVPAVVFLSPFVMSIRHQKWWIILIVQNAVKLLTAILRTPIDL